MVYIYYIIMTSYDGTYSRSRIQMGRHECVRKIGRRLHRYIVGEYKMDNLNLV